MLAQRKMVGVLFRQGVACVAYAPLGRAEAMEHPVVADIAARRGRTPAQVGDTGAKGGAYWAPRPHAGAGGGGACLRGG